MAEIVYVKEYQPSSAILRIGQDPIYKQSEDDEYIRIFAPPPIPNWLLLLPLLGLAYLLTRS